MVSLPTRRETIEGARPERFNCRAKSDSLTIVVESSAGATLRTGSWASKPENESRQFIGKMRLRCANPPKSATLCYTVSHLLFGRRKNGNREQAVKSSTSTKRRDGGTGRRSGLKIRRPSGLGGSTPPPGTMYKFNRSKGLSPLAIPLKSSGLILEKRQCVYIVLKV